MPIDLTQILDDVATGEPGAADRLFVIVYDKLRQLASRQLANMPSDFTLQSTALVHELWLKLFGDGQTTSWKNREHFFAAAAQAMRHILVDAARARQRLKRGGQSAKFELRDTDLLVDADENLLALDAALTLLQQQDEAKVKLIELRYFAGMTNAEAAKQLGISTATAERYWAFARAWLRREIERP